MFKELTRKMNVYILVILFSTATLASASCISGRSLHTRRSVSVVQVKSAVDVFFERLTTILDKSFVFALEIVGAKATLTRKITTILITTYRATRPFVKPTLQVAGTMLLSYEILRYMDNESTAFAPVYRLFGDVAGSMGMSMLAKVLRYAKVSPAHAETFDIWFRECKKRAFCEVGGAFTKFSHWIASLGELKYKFPILGPFLDGIEGMDCEVLYPDCPYTSQS